MGCKKHQGKEKVGISGVQREEERKRTSEISRASRARTGIGAWYEQVEKDIGASHVICESRLECAGDTVVIHHIRGHRGHVLHYTRKSSPHTSGI